MKTNQLMIRKMGDFEVIQRTLDGFFEANGLLYQWNSKPENKRRRLDVFFENKNTKEFLDALIKDESQRQNVAMGLDDVIKRSKGKNTRDGKTPDKLWVSPLVFIKLALYINPAFEVKVLRFVYDEMIKYRNDAGDAYVKLASSISKIVNKDFMPRAMSKIGEALNYITFNEHEKNLRNKFGEESKLRELYMLENKVSELIDEGFINTYDNLIKYLRNLYFKRYTPEIFSSN